MKSKESQYKKGQYIKNKYEKKLMLMQLQTEQLQTYIIERDKEIKLYRMKLKEMMQTTLGTMTPQLMVDVDNLM